jgi:hypothetical protein
LYDEYDPENDLVSTATYGRNAIGELTALVHAKGATTLASYSYDVGRVRTVTSYHDVTLPAATVNQVEYLYDGWGNLAAEYQAHDGEVDEESTPVVQYHYADGATAGVAAYVRLDRVTYPDSGSGGRNVGYDYSAGVDDIMSRLSSIFDDANGNGVLDTTPTAEAIYSSYKYLGLGRIVEEDSGEAKLSYLTSGNVTGLDRFGRVVDQVWTDSSNNIVDEYKYGYDRAGNRLWKQNLGPNASALDELYAYDDLDRLVDAKYGTLNVTNPHNPTITATDEDSWTLDTLGNNLAAGTYNTANEETPTGQSGNPYDAAGNMITLQSGNSAIYDAWNRLVKVTSGSGREPDDPPEERV